MHRPHAINDVDDTTLECLIDWPTDTVGWQRECVLVRILNTLCKEHGYGYVPWLVSRIEDIWRHPENVTMYKVYQADRRALVAAEHSPAGEELP